MLYIEMLVEWAGAFLPTKINAVKDIQLVTSVVAQSVVLCYFDLIPTLIFSCLTMVPTHVRRVIFYNDPVLEIVASTMISFFNMTLNVVFLHCVTTKAGMIFVDREVLKDGIDQTLDNFDEGVIILDEQDMSIRFYNKAASVSNAVFDSTVVGMELKPEYTSFVKENKLRQFAKIDKTDLNKQVADVDATVKKIRDLKEYSSMQEVI